MKAVICVLAFALAFQCTVFIDSLTGRMCRICCGAVYCETTCF